MTITSEPHSSQRNRVPTLIWAIAGSYDARVRVTRASAGTMGGVAPLRGFRFLQMGDGAVARRAGTLLALLGAEVVALLDPGELAEVLDEPAAPHRAGRLVATGDAALARRIPASGVVDGTGRLAAGPAVVSVSWLATGRAGWAASGAMALTGTRDGHPLAAPGDQAAGLAAAAAVVELLSALGGRRVVVDGPALAGERAALAGLTRRGRINPGGSCRLLRAADGWIAVNLPRPTDLDLLEAWLGAPQGPDPWRTVEEVLARRPVSVAVAAGQELGLAVSRVVAPREAADDEQARARHQSFPMAPFLADGRTPRLAAAQRLEGADRLDPPGGVARRVEGARVVDLSSLWAGPLATSLLAAAGADVVKVESTTRPDGARYGDPRFFALLNADKRSVTVDFGAPSGRARLAALVERAALVVEASRPRAFEQLGLDPDTWCGRHPARTWLSITAYGRTGPWRQWSGFGDDAAVAGGLVVGPPSGPPLFCGDAYADPATGLHAAAVALAGLVGSGGRFDMALREVVNHLLAGYDRADASGASDGPYEVQPPRARSTARAAPAAGTHNDAVLGEVGATDPQGRSVAEAPIARRPLAPSTKESP